ncbi:hypothetical protein ACDX78_13605 [Virgibacillus oceani]
MQATTSITEELHKQLESKDLKIAELRASNRKYASRSQYAEKKLENYLEMQKHDEEINPSELAKLESENTRLRAEVNQLRRDRRDARKFKKIYTIVTGEEIE